MSLVVIRTRLLSLVPRVIAAEQWLLAETPRLLEVLTLFSYRRSVYVDARTESITIGERYFFRTKRRRLSFRELDRLEYRYASLPTSLVGYRSFRSGPIGETADRGERFVIAVVTKTEEVVDLFAFIGEGAATTGFIGVLLGDSLVDFEGDQEDASRIFLDHLTRLTGLGLGVDQRTREVLEKLLTLRCETCGHANVEPRAKCLYCGAPFPRDGGATG